MPAPASTSENQCLLIVHPQIAGEHSCSIASYAYPGRYAPGYRDCAKGEEEGCQPVKDEQRYLESPGNKNIKFYPGKG